MADKPEKLSEEDKGRIKNWLSEHWTAEANCPICGANEWIIGDYLIQPLTMSMATRAVKLGGEAYPQVLLISKKCGYTMYFNAVLIGLVPTLPEGKAAEETRP